MTDGLDVRKRRMLNVCNDLYGASGRNRTGTALSEPQDFKTFQYVIEISEKGVRAATIAGTRDFKPITRKLRNGPKRGVISPSCGKNAGKKSGRG